MKPSIYSLTREEMIEWAEAQGEKKFRASQIWEWLYRKRVQSFEEMTNLSKELIAKLNDQFVLIRLNSVLSKSLLTVRSSTSLSYQMVC